MFCSNCGKKIEDKESFCPYCGQALKEDRKAETQRRPPLSKQKPESIAGTKNTRKVLIQTASAVLVVAMLLMLVFSARVSFSGSVASKKKSEDSFGAALGAAISRYFFDGELEDVEFYKSFQEDAEQLSDYKALSPGNIFKMLEILAGFNYHIDEEYSNQCVFIITMLAFLGVINVVTALVCVGIGINLLIRLLTGEATSSSIGSSAVWGAGILIFERLMSGAFIKIINEDYIGTRVVKLGSSMTIKYVFAFLLLAAALVIGLIKGLEEERKNSNAAVIMKICAGAFCVLAIFSLCKLSEEVMDLEITYIGGYERDWEVSTADIPFSTFFFSCNKIITLKPTGTIVCLVSLILLFVTQLIVAGSFMRFVYKRNKSLIIPIIFAVTSLLLLTSIYTNYRTEIRRVCRNVNKAAVEQEQINAKYKYMTADFDLLGSQAGFYIFDIILVAGAAGIYIADVKLGKNKLLQ